MAIGKDMVTVVVPTFNEEKAIGMVLDEVRAAGYKNVLVVDGYSVDGTVKIAESRGVQVVQQNGRGKTGAIRTAVDYVKTPYLLVMDGDYTYCAKDIERLLNHGDRYVHVVGVRERDNMTRVHRFGNWMITSTFNFLLGAGVSDVCSGMYLLRTDMARELELKSKGFSGFEILAAILGLARRYNPVLLFSAIAALSIFPASLILGWVGMQLLLFGVFHNWWAMLGLLLLLLASQALAVSTVSILLKRSERRIMQALRKE